MKLNFCVACGSQSNLEHHHLIPRALSGSDAESNLITLCNSCHNKIHKIKHRVSIADIQYYKRYGKTESQLLTSVLKLLQPSHQPLPTRKQIASKLNISVYTVSSILKGRACLIGAFKRPKKILKPLENTRYKQRCIRDLNTFLSSNDPLNTSHIINFCKTQLKSEEKIFRFLAAIGRFTYENHGYKISLDPAIKKYRNLL